MLEWALAYRRKGFSVIPCNRQKRPLIKWAPFQVEKASEQQIRDWWDKWPNANIGIACGAVSGVDVLDLDTEQAYTDLQEFFLPDTFQTPAVKSPKGRHLYFKHRIGLSNGVRVVAGTDLRTHGGYVIAPPSINGDGTAYAWIDGLAPKDCAFAEWPDELFAVLQQGSPPSQGGDRTLSYNNINNSSSRYVRGCKEGKEPNATTATGATKRNISFSEGSRDDTLFYLANHLIRGGMPAVDAEKYLEFFAARCNPPFPENEIKAKISSAIERSERREINLTATLREFVNATWGNFSATEAQQAATNRNTPEEKHKVRTILGRLVEEGLIERVRGKNAVYRKIESDCKPVDWVNADCTYRDLWLPLGLGEICGVQPGNILIFAGAKDSGKTAFLMNIAKENRHKYQVHYWNSEMGIEEFKLRASLFDDISIHQWNNFLLYNESHDIQDRVIPGEGNLNVVDYLEAPDEVWKIGSYIKKIHERLDGAICVVGIQKKINQDLGRGAEFSMEKSRLYVSLDYGRAKIVSCKNFKQNELIQGSPRGYTTKYKLVNGCRIIKTPPGWTSEIKKEKE